MLYPVTNIDISVIPETNFILAGNLTTISLTIAPLTGQMISMMQVAPTQDFSMRVWISPQQDGQFTPLNASFWYLNRYLNSTFLFYDLNGTPPTTIAPTGYNLILVPVFPANYYLNVLNLVNAQNIFSFAANVVNC